ncbi:multidrug resistance-associated protein 4 [Elysia marginata]|uniref:Multidrug resistance-associated protein 4 n=1 Tax=Elysia marginata TaxID=1093978 RepID=A0AAV4J342_9GAST|nr:multidrug resistance-associated protein 4 [Elysia marginata]
MDENFHHDNPNPLLSANSLSKICYCAWNAESERLNKGKKASFLRALIRVFGVRLMLFGFIALFEETVKLCQPLLLTGFLDYFTSDSNTTSTEAWLYATGVVLCSFILTMTHHPFCFGISRIGMRMRVSSCSLMYKKSLRLSNTSLNECSVGHIVNLMSNDVARHKTAVHTDKRVKVMNEIISGIRIIKLYCWEKPFGRLVENLRRLEIRQLRRTRYAQACQMGPYFASSRISSFLFTMTYVLIGREDEIRPGTVFMVVGVVQSLCFTCGVLVPLATQYLAEILVVIKRIQNFLLLEELENVASIIQPNLHTENIPKDGGAEKQRASWVEIANLTAKWNESSTTLNPLEKISLTVSPGQLVAVIGPVGAGKDLTLLPKGDATLIGDRGVNLSGGQKARVSLARAIYMDADIYLLDDPLAAVDTTVGKHIFDKCIVGYLKAKPRILVTNQVQLLSAVDNIVILTDGQLMGEGTYSELCNSGFDFFGLMKPPEDKTCEKDWRRQSCLDTLEESLATFQGDCRRHSVISVDSVGMTFMPESAQLPDEEERETGNIDLRVFIDYFKAGAGIVLFSLLFLYLLLGQVFLVGCDVWLARWTNEIADHHIALKTYYQISIRQNTTNVTRDWRSTQLEIPQVDTHFNLYVYAAMIVAMFALTLIRALLCFKLAVTAGENLHNMMFARILKATMEFFDNNPTGRVLNRFSKDTGQIDDHLPWVLFDFLQDCLVTAGVVVVSCVFNPWVLIPVVPLMILFIIVRRYYVQTSRSLKRLEGTTRSPVFSHLSTTLQGLHTIRAMHMEQQLTAEFDAHQDLHTEAWFLFLATSRWLAIRLDFLTAIFIASVVYCCMLSSDTMDPGFVGLSVVYTMALLGLSQITVRQSVELENQMISVERVLQYTRLPIEADLESKPGQKPPDTWPSSGSLQAKGVSLRYSPSAPFVLKDINFDIHGGEKIGIVGRTGAGKSSLITALFRLAEPEGELTIDGVSIHSLGLHDLRKVISIIPQDPVLFNGPVRRNLDPFDEYSDSQLWNALDTVQLKEAITSNPDSLYMEVTEGGSNFSAGQRQLMCLARAVLGNTRILLIDEATANVDPMTDELIQQTIRNKFKTCTVLTIAHRLHTVIDSDRIMVLDAGKIVEMGTPNQLLSYGKSGWFYSMIQKLGKEEQEHLIQLASKDQNINSESSSSSDETTRHPLLGQTKSCNPNNSLVDHGWTRANSLGLNNKAFTVEDENVIYEL